MHDKGIQIKNDSAKIKVEKLKLLKGILNIVKDVSSVSGLGSLPIHTIDTIESFKMKDDLGSIAWKLICISLTDSLRTLISEVNLDISKEIIVTDNLENDLNIKLESGEYYLNSDFFKNPGRIPLINDLKPILTKFLALFELEYFEIENILNRLPSYFVFSLAKEWRKNHKYYSILEEHIHTPFDEAAKNEERWFLYSQWIKKQIDKPVFLESFSLRQVYIPLRAYYNIMPNDRNKVNSNIEIKNEEEKRYVVDLEKELLDWLKKSDKDDAIRIIRGGPGIGKSSFLKMFAAKLVEQGRNVLFIPLYLFEIRDDLLIAIKDFLKDDGFINDDPFKLDRLLIIFDGLDELSMQGKFLAEVANQFLQEVERKVTRLNNQKIKLQCIISGRDIVVQQNENYFRKEGQILQIIPYFIQDKEKYIDKYDLLLTDQRDIWWKKYGKLNGKNYDKLPDILKNSELDEITAQPLLNYLISLNLEKGNIDYSKNFIYNEIKASFRNNNYLKTWHDNGRIYTITDFDKFFDDCDSVSLIYKSEIYHNQHNQNVYKSTFLSYSHHDFIEADIIDNTLILKNIKITRDIRDLAYTENINKFEESIREHNKTILLISITFLESENCMYEVVNLLKERKYNEKILPIILNIKNFNQPIFKLELITFWKNKFDNLNKMLEGKTASIIADFKEELKKVESISYNIGEFINIIKSMVYVNYEDSIKDDLRVIIEKIK